MDLQVFEQETQNYMLQRCREHLGQMENLIGRSITFDYRYEHTRTAVAIAGKLAEALGVPPALARIAVWLHDIAKCWDPHLPEATNREREADHGVIGAREAAIFLHSLAFPRDLTCRVEQAIANHAGLVKDYIIEEPLVAIVWDADKLSKIGAAGTLHYLCAQLAMGDELLDLQEYVGALDDQLCRGMRDSLNTEFARQWADRELAAASVLHGQILASLLGA